MCESAPVFCVLESTWETSTTPQSTVKTLGPESQWDIFLCAKCQSTSYEQYLEAKRASAWDGLKGSCGFLLLMGGIACYLIFHGIDKQTSEVRSEVGPGLSRGFPYLLFDSAVIIFAIASPVVLLFYALTLKAVKKRIRAFSLSRSVPAGFRLDPFRHEAEAIRDSLVEKKRMTFHGDFFLPNNSVRLPYSRETDTCYLLQTEAEHDFSRWSTDDQLACFRADPLEALSRLMILPKSENILLAVASSEDLLPRLLRAATTLPLDDNRSKAVWGIPTMIFNSMATTWRILAKGVWGLLAIFSGLEFLTGYSSGKIIGFHFLFCLVGLLPFTIGPTEDKKQQKLARIIQETYERHFQQQLGVVRKSNHKIIFALALLGWVLNWIMAVYSAFNAHQIP